MFENHRSSLAVYFGPQSGDDIRQTRGCHGASRMVRIRKRARRFKNQILCDLHFADVALMECSDFMQQLRSFKPQSLGCAVARRKSSTTLIFPLPPQACSDNKTSTIRYSPFRQFQNSRNGIITLNFSDIQMEISPPKLAAKLELG
ncbi:jg4834 [Pararge aegeria aegeria]|uniref:Jg4834 protein n=1 Tax=Pararge aegeria aegeria TaxID=348720 RepID=A0A8S4QIB0_9NEOP|nr:jg4834 [Pararge aegeria aegeria]